MDRTAPHPVKTLKTPRTTRRLKLQTRKPENNGDLSRGGGGLKVNWPRSRLEIHLRYVGSPEETRWRCESAGRASYGSRRSRVARRGKRKFDRPWVVQKAEQVNFFLGCARADFFKPP